MNDYGTFLDTKKQYRGDSGFEPHWMPSFLMDFQANLVEWAIRRGRAAIFADCGLGKTPMQLVWAQNVVEHTNKPVLILAPLAASAQTMREAAKFSIAAQRSQDGRHDGDAQVVVTNYERLDKFNADDFAGCVCDESSILKNFDGATKALVTEFMRRMPYRLLCTATAAPNDYIELGTSSEALGEMGYMDMLSMFFKNDEGNAISTLNYETRWRFKPHAEQHFWRWLCSWARALRKPSDLGYEDGPFLLPQLTVNVSTVEASRPYDDWLFVVPASDLREQRAERRATIKERCERVAELVQGHDYSLVWCHLNDEGDLLEKMIPGSVQVAGRHSDEHKEQAALWFLNGNGSHGQRVLISKPRIFGFGLNFQHCAHVTFFPSHSYEQYYQGVRRCWRFGQKREVVVDVVTTAGEADVLGNLQRKADAADRMFSMMIEHMQDEMHVRRADLLVEAPTLPAWL